MKIRTYENSVQHGVIDTLKREDLVRDLSSRAQDAQRIITAPALSGRQDAEANESAEAAAAANAEKRVKPRRQREQRRRLPCLPAQARQRPA